MATIPMDNFSPRRSNRWGLEPISCFNDEKQASGPGGGITMAMNRKISFSFWYVLLAIWAVVLVHDFIHALNKIEELPYSQFKSLVAVGKVAEVSVSSHLLTGKLKPE